MASAWGSRHCGRGGGQRCRASAGTSGSRQCWPGKKRVARRPQWVWLLGRPRGKDNRPDPRGIVKKYLIQIDFNLQWFKTYLPLLKKFQLKYVFVENEIRNSVPHWSFSKFGMKFELKFREPN
jgi:hypothetical protein